MREGASSTQMAPGLREHSDPKEARGTSAATVKRAPDWMGSESDRRWRAPPASAPGEEHLSPCAMGS